MRGAWLIGLAACGHATAPVERPPLANTSPDAGPPDALFDAAPVAAPPPPRASLATLVARVASPAGPVPGTPELVIDRIPDATRCGGEDVVVHLYGSDWRTVIDPDLLLALTIATPQSSSTNDTRTWLSDARARAEPALEIFEKNAKNSAGEARIAAEANAILIRRHYYDALLHMRPPPMPNSPPAPPAFCNKVASEMELELRDIDDATRACHDDIVAQHVGPGWWDAVCTAP